MDSSAFEYFGKFHGLDSGNKIRVDGYYLSIDSTYSDPEVKHYSIIKLYSSGEAYHSASYSEKPSEFFINNKFGSIGYFYVDSNTLKTEFINLTLKVKNFADYTISNDSLLCYKKYNRKHKDLTKMGVQYRDFFIDHRTFIHDTIMFNKDKLVLRDYPY